MKKFRGDRRKSRENQSERFLGKCEKVSWEEMFGGGRENLDFGEKNLLGIGAGEM